MASQILDEERSKPTILYELANSPGVIANPAGLLPVWTVLQERGRYHPRTVLEDTGMFRLKSVNFDLLCALMDRSSEQQKQAMLRLLITRIRGENSYRHRFSEIVNAGRWKDCTSELPLVAEFVARLGNKRALIESLRDVRMTPGLTWLLLQLEELIALNFTIFTPGEYTQLENEISSLSKAFTAFELEWRKAPSTGPTLERNTRYHVIKELPELFASVAEECRRAKYMHVKTSLLPGLNFEVNQDKGAVISFLEKLGFTKELIESLNEAERLYRTAATPFDFKSSMGHLRSFLEVLHLQAGAAVQRKNGGTAPSKFGEAHEYLKTHGVLTTKEQQLVIQLYSLISDTSVHPLVAEQEYARLMRNMSIEYGLLLLTKLDKLGVN